MRKVVLSGAAALLLSLSFTVVATGGIAGAYSANNTLYWNTANISACGNCTIQAYVAAFPDNQTPPTTVAEETFASPDACLECIEISAPGAVEFLGYWVPSAVWINISSDNWGTAGFLVDFTNGS